MPPPRMILSTFERRLSITVIFEETFDPPTIAQKGRFGELTAPSR